jgi:hypothetical protein
VEWDDLSPGERLALKSKQGRPPFGVEMRCVSLDDPAEVLRAMARLPARCKCAGHG